MKKLFTLLTLVVCSLSASADVTTDNVLASENRQNPEHIFNVLSRGSNNYWSKETFPTTTAKGLFAFFAVDGKEDTYRIYSIDEQKWVSYTKQSGYNNGQGFVTVTTENEEDAEYFKFTKGTSSAGNASADKSGYIIAPYNTTNVAAKYLNWFNGPQNNTNKTVGLYEHSWGDAGSVWVLIETTIWNSLSEALDKAKEYPVGEGLCKYRYMVTIEGETADLTEDYWTPLLEECTELLENQNPEDEEEAKDLITDLQEGISYLVINQPAEGSFLRIKGENTKCFITGNGESGRVKLSNEENITTILFYDGTKLIGYNNGRGFDGTHSVAAIGSFETHTFSASPYKKGLYLIKSNYNGSQVLCDGSSSTDLLLNRWADENNIRSAWELTEVTSLPIAINAYGFASVNLPVAIKLGDNTTAWYANTVNGSEVTLLKITGILPANTPAILINKEEKNTTVDFEIDTTAETDDTAGETNYPANHFEGTIAAETTTSDSNYVLSGDGIKKFTGTTLKGFRAYLPVAPGQSIRSMVFEGEDVVTAIEAAEGAVPADGKAYDLNGRSVVRANGVVIVNGKTIAIK